VFILCVRKRIKQKRNNTEQPENLNVSLFLPLCSPRRGEAPLCGLKFLKRHKKGSAPYHSAAKKEFTKFYSAFSTALAFAPTNL
jgi:hypothetical protein